MGEIMDVITFFDKFNKILPKIMDNYFLIDEGIEYDYLRCPTYFGVASDDGKGKIRKFPAYTISWRESSKESNYIGRYFNIGTFTFDLLANKNETKLANVQKYLISVCDAVYKGVSNKYGQYLGILRAKHTTSSSLRVSGMESVVGRRLMLELTLV